MIPRVRDEALDLFSEPYQRAFGDDCQLCRPISETSLFVIFFAVTAAGLLGSGIWVATTGETRIPVWQTITGIALMALLMGVLCVGLANLPPENPTIKLLATFIVYSFLANLLRWLILDEVQPPFFGLSIIQGGSLGLLLAVFSRPLLPDTLVNGDPSNHKSRREALTLHLDNQWRIGQIALTMTVLTVGGLLVWIFPDGGSAVGRKRLMLTALPFVFTLGPVLLYVLRKIFLIEQEVAKTFADG